LSKKIRPWLQNLKEYGLLKDNIMKSITIIRHAESDWTSNIDFERPLTHVGIDDAKIMGNTLINKKINLDIIISSPANRAITTAGIIADQIQFKGKIKDEQYIYGASSEKLFDMLTKLDNSFNSVGIVGHNPTLHILSEKLCNKQFMHFPTCSIVKINFNVKLWNNITIGELEYFIFPGLYKNFN